jgi:Transcription factor WhiB
MSQTGTHDRLPDLSAGSCRTPAAAAVFRDINTATMSRAVAICRDCPAVEACRDWGIRHEQNGVWGGLGEHGLAAERLNRGIRLQEIRQGEIAPRAKMQRRAATP